MTEGSDREWTRRDRDDLLAALDPDEPYTTREIADLLGWPDRTVHHILDELAAKGKVRKKKPSERRVIWMLVD